MVARRRFSLYEIEQFIREAGAEKVTEDAVLDLEREMERLFDTITKKAITYAVHAGRTKLIKEDDIILAENIDEYALISSEK